MRSNYLINPKAWRRRQPIRAITAASPDQFIYLHVVTQLRQSYLAPVNRWYRSADANGHRSATCRRQPRGNPEQPWERT